MSFLTRVIVIQVLLLLYSFGINCESVNIGALQELTDIFFANLKELPGINPRVKLSENDKSIIDGQVENFLRILQPEVNEENEFNNGRKRRGLDSSGHLTKDLNGVHKLNGFKQVLNIKSVNPKDVHLFRHKNDLIEKWYAVVIEESPQNLLPIKMSFVIYKFDGDNNFEEVTRKTIINGVKLGTYTINDSTIIIVAENRTVANENETFTNIYEFDFEEHLNKVQSLNVSFATDVAIWKNQNEIFMTIAQSNFDTSKMLEIPIYKWVDSYFDIVDNISTENAQSIVPFTIGNSHYLAVSNGNGENRKSFVEIFKYNRNTNQFQSYQKLLTQGLGDVKYFCFQQYEKKESFLVVSNTYDRDINNPVIYNIDSIIYKLIDNYFMPFQNIKLNDLIEWQPLVGFYGHFALVASCKNSGIKTLQYDGWKFVEIINVLPQELSINIVSMHSHIFFEVPVLVIANEHQNTGVNIFQPNFEDDRSFNNFYDEMFDWCKEELKTLQEQLVDQKLGTIAKREINPFAEMILTENLPIEIIENDSPLKTMEAQNLLNILNNRRQILNHQQSEIESSYLDAEVNIVDGDIFAENVVVNNEAFLEHLIAEKINNYNVVDVLSNVITINDGFIVAQSFELESATVLNEIRPTFINGHLAESILTETSDLELSNLIVNGSVKFMRDLTIGGKINNFTLSSSNILLNSGNQSFNSDLNSDSIQAKFTTTKFLNKLTMSEAKHLNTNQQELSQLSKITVDNIIVAGYINLVDVPTIDKYALRNTGDQIITEQYFFDTLLVEDLEILDKLSGKSIPQDLVRIDEGNYHINNDVQFIKPVTIENLKLSDRFNEISVVDGFLDVLLENDSEIQDITGVKTFDEVELKHPVKLQGKLKSFGQEGMNPMKVISGDLELFGDYVITGDVTIEEDMSVVGDLAAEEKKGSYSINRLLEKGLRLTEKEIDLRMEFLQALEVEELFVDTINNIEPNSWILNREENTQIVTGKKIVEGDLVVDGLVNLHVINGVDLSELEANILTISGEQTISGNLIVEEITVDIVNSIKAQIGLSDWNNIVTSNTHQIISGITEINNLINVNSIVTNSLQTFGNINNIHFDSLINDTVFTADIVNNNPLRLDGLKTFSQVTTNTLSLEKELDMTSIPELLNNPEAIFDSDDLVRLPSNVAVKSINFENKLNAVTAGNLASGMLRAGGNQTLFEDQFFDKVIVIGKVFVESGFLNNLNLSDMMINSVKQNEEHSFDKVTFEEELISLSTIHLDGYIENLDLENLVLDSQISQEVFDTLVFHDEVFVEGKLEIAGKINNNFSIEDISRMVFPEFVEEERHLIISGNAHFSKGLHIVNVNGFSPIELLKSAWLINQPMTIPENIIFDDVVFNNNLQVNGFVDQVNLDWLSKNYLSKTKDQNVTAHYYINGINFAQGVLAPSARVNGAVFGIHLLEFMRTALLEGLDQVFENTLMLESCVFNNLSGNYLVNNLLLESDVMRYDAENIVTGVKTINSLACEKVRMNDKAKIQEIDVINWIQNSASKTESFKLRGKLILLNNATFENGIALEGLLNKKIFNEETILLKTIPQNITGIKTFTPIEDKPTILEAIDTNLIYGIDINNLVNNQVYKFEDVIFDSQVNLHGIITTDNVYFKRLFNGVNMSELVYNLDASSNIMYHEEKYANLMHIANEIKLSSESQAYFVNDYKLEGSFENAKDVIPIKFHDNIHRLAVLRSTNLTDIVSFFKWDEDIHQFVLSTDSLQIVYNKAISYINTINFGKLSYLYIETESANPISYTSHLGTILRVNNQSSFEIIQEISTNGSKVVHSFILPDKQQSCLLFVYKSHGFVDILCESDGNSAVQIHEKLEIENAKKVTSVIINDIPYIIIINGDDCVQIWKFDANTRLFNIHQVIHSLRPNDISVISYRNDVVFLAISSAHIEDTVYNGHVEIRRFHPDSGHFTLYQTLAVHHPLELHFTVLPTRELHLYILTGDSSVAPLLVYAYRGVQKFTVHFTIAAIPVIGDNHNYNCVEQQQQPQKQLQEQDRLRQYTDIFSNHFVVVRGGSRPHKETSVIKAMFAGKE